MRSHYILKGHEPVPVGLLTWAKWFEEKPSRRKVRVTTLGDVRVSTVFLGLDHGFSMDPNAKPILFETLVFGGRFDGEMDRYASWDEAVKGHHRMVRKIKEGGK